MVEDLQFLAPPAMKSCGLVLRVPVVAARSTDRKAGLGLGLPLFSTRPTQTAVHQARWSPTPLA